MSGIGREMAIAVTLLMVFFACHGSAETYKIVVNDAPPYRIIGEGRLEGIYIDIAQEVARRIGVQFDYLDVPLIRALHMMEVGTGDIMLGPNRTPEREKFMVFAKPPLPKEDKVFLLKLSAADMLSYGDLREHLIVVLRGARYFKPFDDDRDLTRIETNSYESALRMVAAGNADTVIIPRQQAAWLIRRHHFALKTASFFVEGNPSHIAISRSSAFMKRLDDLEAAVKGMEEDGTTAGILGRYR